MRTTYITTFVISALLSLLSPGCDRQTLEQLDLSAAASGPSEYKTPAPPRIPPGGGGTACYGILSSEVCSMTSSCIWYEGICQPRIGS